MLGVSREAMRQNAASPEPAWGVRMQSPRTAQRGGTGGPHPTELLQGQHTAHSTPAQHCCEHQHMANVSHFGDGQERQGMAFHAAKGSSASLSILLNWRIGEAQAPE